MGIVRVNEHIIILEFAYWEDVECHFGVGLWNGNDWTSLPSSLRSLFKIFFTTLERASARDVCVTDDTEKSNRERIAIQSRSKRRKKKNSRRRRWEAYASIGGQSEEHHPESPSKLRHFTKWIWSSIKLDHQL